jgi:pyridoxine 5-phosphate synthase
MAVLNVNIDHVATVRQARQTDEPDPVWAAVECELGGAHGITVHLRLDRRHITDRDVEVLRKTVASKFNLEMSLAEPIVKTAERLVPDQITVVPERRQELTTEGGLDCIGQQRRLAQVVRRMHKKGILVSAFIVPETEQVLAAAEAGCDAVELHTGAYASARKDRLVERCLNALREARDTAFSAGLIVHAGHGLTYRNAGPVARLEGIYEFNIGHSIISRAVLVGLRRATEEMIRLIQSPPE